MMNDTPQPFDSNYALPERFKQDFSFFEQKSSYMSLRNPNGEYSQQMVGQSMVNLRGILQKKVVNYD